jgi:hypothetical protein
MRAENSGGAFYGEWIRGPGWAPKLLPLGFEGDRSRIRAGRCGHKGATTLESQEAEETQSPAQSPRVRDDNSELPW